MMEHRTAPWRLPVIVLLAAGLTLAAALAPKPALASEPLPDDYAVGDPAAEDQPPEEASSEQETPAARERPLDQGQVPDLGEEPFADRRVFDPEIERVSPDELIDRAVTNLEGEELGRLDDVVRDRRTGSLHAVIATGGFLGIGERQAAVPLQQLHVAEDGRIRLESAITRDELERMAVFDSHGYQPVERDQSIARLAGLDEEEQVADQQSSAPEA